MRRTRLVLAWSVDDLIHANSITDLKITSRPWPSIGALLGLADGNIWDDIRLTPKFEM